MMCTILFTMKTMSHGIIYVFSSIAIYELVCTKYTYLCCITLMVEYVKKVSQ